MGHQSPPPTKQKTPGFQCPTGWSVALALSRCSPVTEDEWRQDTGAPEHRALRGLTLQRVAIMVPFYRYETKAGSPGDSLKKSVSP